jgi:predicted nucleic-acid-binding Zn-ribbon protein
MSLRADILKCPKCGSERLTVKRIHGGKSWLICLDCNYFEEV